MKSAAEQTVGQKKNRRKIEQATGNQDLSQSKKLVHWGNVKT